MPRASGPQQRPTNPRQRLCRGLPSAKTPREIFRRRRGLCRGPGRPSTKKRSRHAPAPLAVSLPRADPRQRNVFFICLPRADPRQINFFIFLKKPLPRASSLALGKEIFRIFPKKIFAEGYCQCPRQRFFLKKFLFAEGRPSAKK